MKIDLNQLHPKKMLKRLVSLFLGLLVLSLFPVLATLSMQEMMLFAIIYMAAYTFFEIIYLFSIVRCFKERKMSFFQIIVLKIGHYLVSWFLLWLISFILKGESYITLVGTLSLFIIEETIYQITTYHKEDASCQRKQ